MQKVAISIDSQSGQKHWPKEAIQNSTHSEATFLLHFTLKWRSLRVTLPSSNTLSTMKIAHVSGKSRVPNIRSRAVGRKSKYCTPSERCSRHISPVNLVAPRPTSVIATERSSRSRLLGNCESAF